MRKSIPLGPVIAAALALIAALTATSWMNEKDTVAAVPGVAARM